MLRSLRAVDFLPHLMELKKTKTVMTMEDLEREFDMALPLASPEDGRRILTAMAESGLILKAGDVVYMDPGEIARTLRSVLPIDVPLIRRRLEEVEREVGPMRELKEAVEVRARRKSTAVNVGFLGFLSLQWGVFIRLCYWELSWDVYVLNHSTARSLHHSITRSLDRQGGAAWIFCGRADDDRGFCLGGHDEENIFVRGVERGGA